MEYHMKIFVLCTDVQHPMNSYLLPWQESMRARGHEVILINDKSHLEAGDILFLVSCGQVIGKSERAKYKAVLVLHASKLPKGRGWSPHIWAIIEGADEIEVCLLAASDPIDSGDIWLRQRFMLEGHELLPEINEKLFSIELALMTQAVEHFNDIEPETQQGISGPYLRKRTQEDSRLDPLKNIAEQFDLLRVVDPDRYPAFMDFRGKRYLIKIEKVV
jgi:methionyl-tRNA formyltransferase